MGLWAGEKLPLSPEGPTDLPPLSHFRVSEVRALLHNILREAKEVSPPSLLSLLWVLLPVGSLPLSLYQKPWFSSAVERLSHFSYSYRDLPFPHRLWLGATVAYRFAPREALGVQPIPWHGRRFLVHFLMPQARLLARATDEAVFRLSHQLAYDEEVVTHFAILRSFHRVHPEGVESRS